MLAKARSNEIETLGSIAGAIGKFRYSYFRYSVHLDQYGIRAIPLARIGPLSTAIRPLVRGLDVRETRYVVFH
jgi:hypothetical protein